MTAPASLLSDAAKRNDRSPKLRLLHMSALLSGVAFTSLLVTNPAMAACPDPVTMNGGDSTGNAGGMGCGAGTNGGLAGQPGVVTGGGLYGGSNGADNPLAPGLGSGNGGNGGGVLSGGGGGADSGGGGGYMSGGGGGTGSGGGGADSAGGGTNGGINGGNGSTIYNGQGGGGGGGGTHLIFNSSGTTILSDATGGQGGAGGIFGNNGGGGGGGGARAILGGTGIFYASTLISGGAGGSGGGNGNGSGGGGGAGGQGVVLSGSAIFMMEPSHSVTGGQGGTGGATAYAGGGGGGGGGTGLSVTGTNQVNSAGTITGGDGGAGGAGNTGGGGGGGGGFGVAILGAGATFTNAGVVTGGAGGLGGESGTRDGVAGLGGAGIFVNAGSVTITNSAGGAITGGGTNASGAAGITVAANATDVYITNSGAINAGGTASTAMNLSAGTTLEVRPGSSVTGNVLGNGAILALGGPGVGTFAASSVGNGSTYRGFSTVEKIGTGTWTLNDATSATVPWVVTDGTLALSGAASLSSASSITVNAGTLDISDSTLNTVAISNLTGASSGTVNVGSKTLNISETTPTTYAGAISGSGTFGLSAGANTLTFSGDSSLFTGAVIVQSGTLALAGPASFANASSVEVDGILDISNTTSGATIGSLVSGSSNAVVELGTKTLTISQDGNGTFFGSFEGSGDLIKEGTEALTLTGDSSAFAGSTTVRDGVLAISAGNLGGNVNVENGAALTGNGGTVGGAVTIASGGILSGGPGGALSMSSLTLDANAITDVALGTANVTPLFTAGPLTLDGTLNISDGGGYGTGVYRVFSSSTALTDNGMALGSLPAGNYIVQLDVGTSTVDVAVSAMDTSLQYWSPGGGTTRGGGGTWDSSTTWLNADNTRAPWAGDTGVFDGTAGVVTVVGTQSLGTLEFLTSGYALTGGSLDVGADGGRLWAEGAGTTATISTEITGAGALTKIGAGTIILSGSNSYQGGTVIQAGTLQISADEALGAPAGGVTFDGGTLAVSALMTTARAFEFDAGGGTLAVGEGQTLRTTGAFTGAGRLTTTGPGTVAVGGDLSAFTGSVSIEQGMLSLFRSASLSNASDVTVNGTFNIAGLTPAATTIHTLSGGVGGQITLGGKALTVTQDADGTFAGIISGTGQFTKDGTATLVLTGNNTYTGGTTISVGTLQLGDGTTNGSITGNVTNNATFAFNPAADTTTTNPGVISGTGNVTQIGPGTTVLTGNSTYTGATDVDAGTLDVAGSIATSRLTSVASGATLTGAGTVGNVSINGGTFSPGNAGMPGTGMNVAGNLALSSGSTYQISLTPTASTSASVGGSASLGGTVRANFANGSYIAKSYTILTASGITGTFAGLENVNLPASFHDTLSYDANAAYLDLALDYQAAPTVSLTGNQQAVANALTNYFNSTGGIPAIYGGLTPAGLTQASGELATGSQQATFQAMDQFMGLLSDPFVAGRGGGFGENAGATPFADEAASAYASTPRGSARDAYAAIYRKAPPVPLFDQRWSVWAAGFGGSQTTDGNAVLGSNNASSSVYGTAVGADYRISPSLLAGFALAGGGTNFNVNGLGWGRSDLFQAGAFARATAGAAYLSAAFAYGWQDITTDRIVTAAGVDHLRATFNANAWSGRLEGGYRYATPWMGLTPYAAAQVTTFELPNYAETVVSGGNAFALSYNSRSVTDTRSELGLRTDRSFAMQDAILTLRGRAAWAHDFNPDRAVSAVFQSLPGAAFVVNGAAQAQDSALTTASVDMRWLNGWSASATFEGEFSNVTRSYAGKGVVRYTW